MIFFSKRFFRSRIGPSYFKSIGTYALRDSVSRKKDGTISHHENHLHTVLQLILNTKMGGVSSINVLFEKLHYLRGFSRVYQR